MAKPSLPKGCRDFTPQELSKRNHVIGVIRGLFELYGFLPIETPALETKETLMGKYGDEGDRLIFKVLNSGNFLDKTKLPTSDSEDEAKRFASEIYDKALRYDLTVPFARFVVQHFNELAFPFKRYQIQPVWRADRPQMGRYREFLQCDADAIGTESLLCEADLIHLIADVFAAIDLKVVILINNRKVLAGIAEVAGLPPSALIDFTVALDKLDKIGLEGVVAEMKSKKIPDNAIEVILPLINLKGDFNYKIRWLKTFLKQSEVGTKGLFELASIHQLTDGPQLELDITLARGLNYYTGAILEVKAAEGAYNGSIAGGGRYDDLTGVFGQKGLSGVGISFGIDRIIDVLNALGKFNAETFASLAPKVMIAHFGPAEQLHGLAILRKLRTLKIAAEIYPDVTKKITKQFEYANKKQIPYVLVIGADEIRDAQYVLKNMKSGTQERAEIDKLIQIL